MSLLHSYASELRLGSFVAVLLLMLVWERFAPRRQPRLPVTQRRLNNLALVTLDTALLFVLFPVAVVGSAEIAEAHGFGLFRRMQAAPLTAAVASLVILDLAIYLQHVLFHKLPWLWRLHRVHHTDLDFDTTTGVRFHPGELALSLVYKMILVALLGVPVAAAILYEILLVASSLFNHGNVTLPAKLERLARRLIVTPDVHRVHHSNLRDETDSNYGSLLTLWDRLFRTFRQQPKLGHQAMTIGVDGYQENNCIRLLALLKQPFIRSESRTSQAAASSGS